MDGVSRTAAQAPGQRFKRQAPEMTDASRSPAAKRLKADSDRFSHSEITFIKSRMFYCRPAFNAYGDITFGLRHIRKSSQLWRYMTL